jgi:NADH-quinone oxidoreductase subunit L
MTVPLIILAVCALLVGLVFGPTGLFERHLGHTLGFAEAGHEGGHSPGWTPYIGLTAGVLGLVLSYFMYAVPSTLPTTLSTRLGRLYEASRNKFYVDEAYEILFVKPTLIAAKIIAFIDVNIVDNLVLLTAWVPRLFGRELLGPFQNGLVQYYAALTALGVAGLLWILLLS